MGVPRIIDTSAQGYELQPVPPQHLSALWPHVYPFLEKGREYLEDYLELEQLYPLVYEGTFDLWIGTHFSQLEIVGLSQFLIYPKIKTLRILWVAGEGIRNFIPFLDFVELLASRSGCSKVEILGRQGWARLLPDYRPTAILLEKDIEMVTEH